MTQISGSNQLIDKLSSHSTLDWRLHGIGFIKAYLDEARTQRIHIYNKMFLTPGITLHHNHPWDLKSTIYAGELTNTRYCRSDPDDEGAIAFTEGQINCVNFNGVEGEPVATWLHPMKPEIYGPGDSYSQMAAEIHASTAIDGTVTVMERSGITDCTVSVFWPQGEKYVNADIGTLSPEQVNIAVEQALHLLQEM